MQDLLGKEAILYEQDVDRVKCTACARYCSIPRKIGLCGIRGNVNGKLRLFVYGKVIAGQIDPIEKKPVIHSTHLKTLQYIKNDAGLTNAR